MRISLAAVAVMIAGGATSAFAWPHISISPPHISLPHISPPHIQIPHVDVGPIAITPMGPVPRAAIPPAQAAANALVNGAAHVAETAIGAQAAPTVAIINLVTGKENLSEAAKSTIKSEGAPIGAVGQAVSDTNAAAHDLKIVAAQSIAGNVGKTVLNIVDGATQLQLEFATTTAIEAGEITAGKFSPERLAAVPLAAALRTAFNQYQAEAKPMPDSVRRSLAPYFPPNILANARWAVSSISLAVPDVIDQGQKAFEGADFAVTVGNITVFSRDPANNLHWWAHELQHQVQYSLWGIDDFAFRYITSCHAVEGDAEAKAQASIPVMPPVAIAC